MKNLRRLFALILALLAVLSTPSFSYAEVSDSSPSTSQYEEYHDQINFETLTVFAVNKTQVVVDIDPTIPMYKKAEAKKQKAKYDRYLAQHPEIASELLDSINQGDFLCAISYTEAPLMLVDDHFERIPKSNRSRFWGIQASAASNSRTSNASTRYRLTLKTSITRSGSSNPYTYTAKTYGTWDNSVSLFNGKEKPAGGNDFILQACPTVTSTTKFSSKYNYSTKGSKNGQQGKNYFMTDGGDSWVKYEVVDDPTGLAQLNSFTLTQTFKAKSTSKTKKINSYYIHTWKAMSVSVSVGGEVGMSGTEPSAGVNLSITPSISNKQWQLYNYVSFTW